MVDDPFEAQPQPVLVQQLGHDRVELFAVLLRRRLEVCAAPETDQGESMENTDPQPADSDDQDQDDRALKKAVDEEVDVHGRCAAAEAQKLTRRAGPLRAHGVPLPTVEQSAAMDLATVGEEVAARWRDDRNLGAGPGGRRRAHRRRSPR
ncbi:hypothetical protein ATE80_09305 [Streptomyces kanasensis]|uniref:Uncharacterized protein n=1 Tax=Streptomyces kanasensis TaxID=936756 RepID=A0A117IX02_9ACTN|nr:hypothetical protein ATE80_09305 [Streptomyces kanasensis]